MWGRISVGIVIAFAFSSALAAEPNTMPDYGKTPGVLRDPPLTLEEICHTKWGMDARAVNSSMKRSVYQHYGFTGPKDPRCIPDHPGSPTAKTCEIDHLISRELGGADDVRNLWPQPYGGPWNAHDKDRLENDLHKDVCADRMALDAAQAAIRDDWQAAYLAKYRNAPSSTGN
jgi:hypothetical protein